MTMTSCELTEFKQQIKYMKIKIIQTPNKIIFLIRIQLKIFKFIIQYHLIKSKKFKSFEAL